MKITELFREWMDSDDEAESDGYCNDFWDAVDAFSGDGETPAECAVLRYARCEMRTGFNLSCDDEMHAAILAVRRSQ